MKIEQIEVGDMVKVVKGARAGNTEVVIRIANSSHSYSPICDWDGGPSVRYFFLNGGYAHHYALDPVDPIVEKNWLQVDADGKWSDSLTA